MAGAETKRVRARYRPIGANPFELPFPRTGKIEVDVPLDMPPEEIERLAREATPKGYEFIEVVDVS